MDHAFRERDLPSPRVPDGTGSAYLAGVIGIMSGLWLWGATGGDLHPNAFRDGFLNFTGVGIVISLVMAVIHRIGGGDGLTDAVPDSERSARVPAGSTSADDEKGSAQR